MEEERNGSRERSAPYSPHHGTNPINSVEESSHDHRSKRRKHGPILEEEEDRISTLLDSILLRILSSLLTKDAIKTGVLSKRWAYLWTSVPSLCFTDTSFKNADVLATAVDESLLLHRAPKLTNFSVLFKYKPHLKRRVDRWVRFATTAKVDQLSLRLSASHLDPYENDTYKLPQHLYADEFVSELDFHFCEIKPNGLVGWSSLKRLCIGYTDLSEDVINKVLMGSPKLEFLKLQNCVDFNRFDILLESLRKLVIDSCSLTCHEPIELEIVAPKIESLEILGHFYGMTKCQIKDGSALVEVKLDFEISIDYESGEAEEVLKDSFEVVSELFENLHQVKKLFVGEWCLKILSIMSVKNLPSPSVNCKCLTMKATVEKWDLPGIAILLQSFPYVETLVIDIISKRDFLATSLLICYDEMSHSKSKEVYFKSSLRFLKTVKIFGFRKSFHIEEVFILVVEFLLKNAKVLEKLVITEPQVMQNETHDMLLKYLQVSQKLLSFPRASPRAVVMFPF
ncbi:hypothetical protein ACB092_05G266200 [Castanea dentata]